MAPPALVVPPVEVLPPALVVPPVPLPPFVFVPPEPAPPALAGAPPAPSFPPVLAPLLPDVFGLASSEEQPQRTSSSPMLPQRCCQAPNLESRVCIKIASCAARSARLCVAASRSLRTADDYAPLGARTIGTPAHDSAPSRRSADAKKNQLSAEPRPEQRGMPPMPDIQLGAGSSNPARRSACLRPRLRCSSWVRSVRRESPSAAEEMTCERPCTKRCS